MTNTNWQNYSGESTLGYLAQFTGLTVQNFMSAAVGLVVAIALIRGFTRSRHRQAGQLLGGRHPGLFRLLLPLAFVVGLALIAGGAIDNFSAYHTYHHAVRRAPDDRRRPGGLEEAIKDLGNNGGGFFNANSAHPFENPNPFTNWLRSTCLLLIPFALPRTFGKMVGDNQQGYAIVAVMAIIWVASVGGITFFEEHRHRGTATAGGPRARWRARSAVRHARLLPVRRVHHADLDRRGQQHARFADPVRRRHRAVRHDARRDRARRHRGRACTAC